VEVINYQNMPLKAITLGILFLILFTIVYGISQSAGRIFANMVAHKEAVLGAMTEE
jgi:hypothetical protein